MSSGVDFVYTGNVKVDSILNAVSEASNAYHDSTLWDFDDCGHNYLVGDTPAKWVENAAQDVADYIKFLESELRSLSKELGINVL